MEKQPERETEVKTEVKQEGEKKEKVDLLQILSDFLKEKKEEEKQKLVNTLG